MCDTSETAIAKGFTRPVYIDFGSMDVEALIRPETDLDGRFKAFDIANNEWLNINGWLATVEDVSNAPEPFSLFDVCMGQLAFEPLQLDLFPELYQ